MNPSPQADVDVGTIDVGTVLGVLLVVLVVLAAFGVLALWAFDGF